VESLRFQRLANAKPETVGYYFKTYMMLETDKDRILNFLIGKEKLNDFESWVYNDPDLESRVGGELYFELISVNYKDKFALDNLNRIIIGNYVAHTDFEYFKYKSILKDSGWHKNRHLEINFSRSHWRIKVYISREKRKLDAYSC
jgi:hypothetical protein